MRGVCIHNHFLQNLVLGGYKYVQSDVVEALNKIYTNPVVTSCRYEIATGEDARVYDVTTDFDPHYVSASSARISSSNVPLL